MEKIKTIAFSKNRLGFSLIELLISLIIIGVITAAFAPIMTKKLQKEKTALSFKTTTKCDDINSDCKLCASLGGAKKCLSCNKKCSVGQYLDISSCSCPSCSDNCLICSSNTNCSSCREGYGLNNGACSLCIKGQYSSGKVCRTCPNGTYSNATKQANCINCEAGYACQNGNRSECVPGTYSEGGASNCITCPSGTYNSGYRNTSCKICEQGYICIGGSSRTACLSGTYSENGASSCTTCPKGSYCLNGLRKNCPDNTTSASGANSQTQCTCNAGYYRTSGTSNCSICTAGYYCTGGNRETCPNNKTSESGASKSSDCNTCKAGYYKYGSTCLKCPETGYYCVGDEKISCKTFDENCTSCNSSGCTECNSSSVLRNKKCKSCSELYGKYCKRCNEDPEATSLGLGCINSPLGCPSPYKIWNVGGINYCHLNLRMVNQSTLDCHNGALEKCCWLAGYDNQISQVTCNLTAAEWMCGENNLRLPSESELASIKELSSGTYQNIPLLKAILNANYLCFKEKSDGMIRSACNFNGNCPGGSGTVCTSYMLWGQGASIALENFTNITWAYNSYSTASARVVRCVPR